MQSEKGYQMRKAFLEQVLLGFLLIMGLISFVATVEDESNTRAKINQLKNMAKKSTESMAHYYRINLDMCKAEKIVKKLFRNDKLGKKLMDMNKVVLQWNDTNGDGEPDQVSTTILEINHSTFWYKFLKKNAFQIGPFKHEVDIDIPHEVTITYGDRPSALYKNSMGIYELDDNNCITNVEMKLANSKDWDTWEETYTDQNGVVRRIPIVDRIQSPPKRIFFIANGFQAFSQPDDDENISFTDEHCFGDTEYPEMTINGVTRSANIFFEDTELNADGYNHMHIIPVDIQDDYNYYKQHVYEGDNNERDKYEAFKTYADILNEDTNPHNDINYRTDPNDHYKYAMEDLDGRSSDFDFSDLLLDSQRKPIKNEINEFTVAGSGEITLHNCDEDEENIPPEVLLGNCPIVLDENTQSNEISWITYDTDGTVVSRVATANNGTADINSRGFIKYSPNPDFDGNDVITFTATDDEGASTSETCDVQVNNVNKPPSISGTPQSVVTASTTYIFIPTVVDLDGDSVSLNIANLPPWATFNSNTGEISGIPKNEHVGEYHNITIFASDGKGGTDSLRFSIEVMEDESNNPPVLVNPFTSPQVVGRNENISINALGRFQDPDGDDLTYKIEVTNGVIPGTQSINGATHAFNSGSNDREIIIRVIASDGDLETIAQYTVIVRVTPPTYLHDFNTLEGWSDTYARWDVLAQNWLIEAPQAGNDYGTSYTFAFGQEFANKTVNITMDVSVIGNWISGSNPDKFTIKINGQVNKEETPGQGKPQLNFSYEEGNADYPVITGTTNANGQLILEVLINVTDTRKTATIDNVEVFIATDE